MILLKDSPRKEITMSSQQPLFYIHANSNMTVRELKSFLASVPDEAVIELSSEVGDIRLDNFRNNNNEPKLIVERV